MVFLYHRMNLLVVFVLRVREAHQVVVVLGTFVDELLLLVLLDLLVDSLEVGLLELGDGIAIEVGDDLDAVLLGGPSSTAASH